MKHPDLDLNLGEFSWCLHCECVHKTTSWRDNGWECPVCSAGSFDLWAWEEVRKSNESYPSQPGEGKEYPLYAVKAVL